MVLYLQNHRKLSLLANHLTSILFRKINLFMQFSPRKYVQNPQHQHQASKHHGKCVCQICNCSKNHKCPPKALRLQTQTTSKFYYKPHNISPQKQQKVARQPLNTHYDPSYLKTNYNTDYKPYKIDQEVRPMTARAMYSPSKFKFQDQTQYKKRYSPIKLKTQNASPSPVKRQMYKPNPIKFEGTSTYTNEFSPKKIQQQSFPVKKYQYQPNKIPFAGETTYNSLYKAPKIQAYGRQPQVKKNVTFMAKPKFEGQTRYREFYQPQPITPTQKCYLDYLPQRPHRGSPQKNHTHYNNKINNWE